MATGFCSGVAGTDGQCGAVTGAILAINLITGRETPEDERELNYKLIQALIARFEATTKSLNCTQLLGCRLGTEEGKEYFEEHGLKSRCFSYVEESLGILFDLFEEHSVD